MSTTSVQQYLEQYKTAHGEDAWRNEVTRLASQAIKTGEKHAEYWKDMTKDFDWLGWDHLEDLVSQGGASKDPELMMAELLKSQMPAIKSQAQYDAVMGALDAVRVVMNAILTGDAVTENMGRKALDMAFQAAEKATEVTGKLEEVPEAASSEGASAFKEAPVQFTEVESQKEQLSELAAITTPESLSTWYADSKGKRDKIVTQSLRNELLDAVRSKKSSLR